MFVVVVTQLNSLVRFFALDKAIQEPYWCTNPKEAQVFPTMKDAQKAVDLVLDEDPIRYSDGRLRPGKLCAEALGLSDSKPSARGVLEIRNSLDEHSYEVVERHGLHGQVEDIPLRGMAAGLFNTLYGKLCS